MDKFDSDSDHFVNSLDHSTVDWTKVVWPKFQWTEDYKHGSCQIANELEDALRAPDTGQNFGNVWATLTEWCAAQPKAVRRKYGSHY